MMALGSALVLSLTSCDPCKDVTCENDGTCEDGTCVCADMYYGDACETHCMNGTYAAGDCTCEAGYEGDACDVESRTNWVGNFNGEDNCGFAYESAIANGTNVDEINFSNFAGFDVTVVGQITAPTTLVINSQTDAAGRKFEGSGSLASTFNTVTVDYTVTYSDATTESCTITYSRK